MLEASKVQFDHVTIDQTMTFTDYFSKRKLIILKYVELILMLHFSSTTTRSGSADDFQFTIGYNS
jgi:hypothetical protein